MTIACSIIIPVYNDPGYLADALASVRAQTRADWEAIVVDDGSEDERARTTVDSFDDPRFTYIRHDRNRGLAAARNTGIRAATSAIIVPLDSDDELLPEYLARIVPYLEPDSGFNSAFSDYEGFGEVDEVIHQGISRRTGVFTFSADELMTLLRFQWMPASGGSFTRALWEDVGGYCEADALRIGDEDFDFWVGALDHGLRPIHVAQPLCRYRVGSESMMTRLRKSTWKTHNFIYERHRAIFDRTGNARGFLADGYIGSAEATRTIGDRTGAISLAIRALRYQPWRSDAYGVIGRALLPTAVHDGLRAARRRVRGEVA